MKRRILLIIGILILVLYASPFYRASNPEIQWTKEELEFIEKHPVIRLGIDPNFVPFEFIDKDKNYKGIAADYIQILREKTGLEMEVVEGLTWPEAYEKALEGDIDVLPAVSKTPEREEQFLFSEPYYYFKRVIVTRDTTSSIKGIEDLERITVAVQKNSSHHSYLLSFPRINLSLYESVETALTSVANGSETAFVGNLATTNYLIRSTGLTNLKFVAFEAEKQQAIHFAVRKDWPELVGILNKALDTITEEERISINNKWIGFESEMDYGPIFRIVLIIGSLIFFIWLISIFWIVRLRKEIEKRKRIQIDLEKAKQEADAANNIKSSFMARMSHEIRTPLNAITGMAYLLKKDNISQTQKMYVERIVQASNNMLRIVNDILDFSKIEVGKIQIDRISFSLDQVIQEVVNIVSYKIEEQEIELRLTKDPEIPNWFYGDSKRIEQILLNIINNAVKFTTSGEILFHIRLVAREANMYYLSFTIKDTGIGMSEEQIKQLFQPFTQGDASITRRFGGTGLGLSIVKNLIDMMGGDIQVFSTEGEGSTFVIQLALEVDAQKEKEYKKQMSAYYFKDIKTLVLEKSGGNINIIDSYLSAFGMNCELTTSPVSAINMLETANGKPVKPYDLLILDYDTPIEGGFKFIESLRNNKRIVSMPKIIMLLPMMREDLFDKLDENGVHAGIGKPIIPSILFNGILETFKANAIVANGVLEPIEEKIMEPSRSSHGILVVEDNKTNLLIVKSLLKQAGFSVWSAENGAEGIMTFREHIQDIDLILMDLHMPVLNGYDASIKIREISKSVPIVAMTADVIQGVKEKCHAHGINHYISKPFEPEYFIQTLSNIIEASSAKDNENLDILNKSRGLKNLGNNAQLYEMILGEYYKENKNTIESLSLAINEKRYSDAIQIVHKTRSSTGSIGADKLHSVAVSLQKSLEEKDEEEIKSHHTAFNTLLKELLQIIRKSTRTSHYRNNFEDIE